MIVFPFPPSIDSAYGQRKGHQRYYSKRAKEWLAKCPKLFPSMIDYPVHIAYSIYFPDKRVRDCSNYTKLIEDFLVKSKVLLDDNWKIVESFTVAKNGIDKANPRIEVEIVPIFPIN